MNASGNSNRRIGNPKMNFSNNRGLISYPSDNFILTSFLAGGGGGGGLYLPPPSLSHSYPPSVPVFRPQHHRSQEPPLLPLPTSMPPNHHKINLANNNIPQINKKIKSRARDHSLTPKKSKNQKKDSKKEEADLPDLRPPTSPEMRINQKIRPDPKDLPKNVISRVLSSPIKSSTDVISVDKFSGSVVFTPSPPPSSLPLPTFSLRPKLSCKAEAAASGIDAGATDSLRRLLRLR